jgi:hypothetical protein
MALAEELAAEKGEEEDLIEEPSAEIEPPEEEPSEED